MKTWMYNVQCMLYKPWGQNDTTYLHKLVQMLFELQNHYSRIGLWVAYNVHIQMMCNTKRMWNLVTNVLVRFKLEMVVLDVDECNAPIPACPQGKFCVNAPGGVLCESVQCKEDPTTKPYMGRPECCRKEPGKKIFPSTWITNPIQNNDVFPLRVIISHAVSCAR